jgi:hypothetical protein
MFSKEKSKALFLRMAGVSLGVLLLALGGTFGAGLSPFAPPTEMARAATPALDSTCQAIIETSGKLFNMPFHFYLTDTGADGKSTTMESIFVDGAVYTPLRGKWFRMPLSSADTEDMVPLMLKAAKNLSCHALRDESVNGESATVYSVHSEDERGIHDGQVWISKSKGLLLREENDVQKPGERGKSHASLRIDYNNVQAPKVWEPLR